LSIPDDLGQTEIGNLDHANATSALAGEKFAFVNLVFIARLTWLGVFAGNKRDWIEE
jgi:hypothetical protein